MKRIKSETLEEAREIEAAKGLWRVEHVAAILAVERTTIYSIGFLRQRQVLVGRRGARWYPSDVRLYIALGCATPRDGVG